MRVIENLQLTLGEISIKDIKLDAKSRDDVAKILRGLKHLYCDDISRENIFALLEELIPDNISKTNGRPGMPLWQIFVMGMLRLNLNWDYDRLHGMVNDHKKIREMLCHGLVDEDHYYELQTIKDNVKLFTPELLSKINDEVVSSGHRLLKVGENDKLKTRCDSFVVETNVHFPTDINLLFDAIRKVIELIASLFEKHELTDWRQSKYLIRQIKKMYRAAQNSKRGGKSKKTKNDDNTRTIEAHTNYVVFCENLIARVNSSLNGIAERASLSLLDVAQINIIKSYIEHVERQMNQIIRRVVNGETIPNSEKVYSIFQPHTEWISKGKLGVPVELGIKVSIVEDQYQFILHHRVMEKESDSQVAVPIATDTKERFPNLSSMSFDRGYYSKENCEELAKILDNFALPKRGKLSKADKELQASEGFIQSKEKHSAVESAINALDVHGLDKCPDHGIKGFKCYVAMAIVARNIQRIGAILQKKEKRKLELCEKRLKRESYKKAA